MVFRNNGNEVITMYPTRKGYRRRYYYNICEITTINELGEVLHEDDYQVKEYFVTEEEYIRSSFYIYIIKYYKYHILKAILIIIIILCVIYFFYGLWYFEFEIEKNKAKFKLLFSNQQFN